MAEHRSFVGVDFAFVGHIEPDRGPDGAVVALMPQTQYRNARSLELHAHGTGPFCRFTAGRGESSSGVYVVTVADVPMYAGKCVNLAERWGPRGYGAIHPRNCYAGGQATNCKVNSLILQQASRGLVIALWFHANPAPASIERNVILGLKPAWNRQIPRG